MSSAEKETNFAHFIIIAVAKFTFEATTKDEIDFEKGDELSDVVAAEDEGWSKGKNGKTGKTGYRVLEKFDRINFFLFIPHSFFQHILCISPQTT